MDMLRRFFVFLQHISIPITADHAVIILIYAYRRLAEEMLLLFCLQKSVAGAGVTGHITIGYEIGYPSV